MGQAAEMALAEVMVVRDSRTSCDWELQSWFFALAVVLEEAHAWSWRWSED